MGLCFQKSLRRAIALALIFAVSSPVSASLVTWTSKQNINEDESFEYIATGRMDLSITPIAGIGREDENQRPHTETIRYLPAVEAAKEDLQAVKRSVIASDLLTYPQSYENHQTSFQNLITQVYRHTQLSRCQDNPLEEISVKLFKVSQKHLGTSNERPGEWARDETLGGFFTFTFNKNRNVSILVNDLNVVLPLYSNHRYSDGGENTLAPYGVNLTENQLITGQFINRVLNELSRNDPAALKAGIKFRLRPENSAGSLETLFNRFTQRNLPLQIHGVEDRERSFLRGLIYVWQEFERNNPNPFRILDYIRNTRNSPFLVKYPDFALEVGQQIVARRKEEIKQIGDRERTLLLGLIDTWQEGENINPNPARILDYIRNTRNSPLLVKYPALAFEVGQKIVVKRKAEITKQTADQERLLLQTLIYKWQEGEKTNPNPARILDYIRNTNNSHFLVKYPDFAVEVGKKIVARRKEEINYYL